MKLFNSYPTVGCIYDYILGGLRYTQDDRAVAEELVRNFPALQKWMRLQQWFFSHIADEFAKAGLPGYIDLATGISTQDYLHNHLPEKTPIIYTNLLDPTSLDYTHQMIGDRPNITYIEVEPQQLTTLLEFAERFFKGQRRIGVSMIGLTFFLEESVAQSIIQRFYEWAAPGSLLAVSHIHVDNLSAATKQVDLIFKQIGRPVYLRQPETISQLMGKWRVRQPGLRSVEEYIEVLTEQPIRVERTTNSGKEELVGALFEKR